MDSKTKQDFIKLFNQGFEEVVLPEIEELRKDILVIKKEVGNLRQGQDRIGNTLDRVADKVNDHANKISKLEKRNPTSSPLS